MNQAFVRMLKRASHSLLFYAACIGLLTVVAVLWSVLSSPSLGVPSGLVAQHAAVPTTNDWGAIAIRRFPTSLANSSPIAAANACGMGASSCFKCHNSGRGPAISKSAWHTDHEQVNNDCVGCHQGSPWILKKSLAHAGLVADPRTQPQKSCAACHQSANVSKLVAGYLQATVPQPK